MNLFIELHEARYGTTERRFGAGWENLFTEQLAFFLSSDLVAASALARLFLGGRDAAVTGVSTQQGVSEGTPDLRIEFADGSCLHVEHKFDAPLGHYQLERYLRDGKVALVSRCNQTVPDEVLACRDYLRPEDRPYFHWVDIYNALPPAASAPKGFGAMREHFRGYMRELGLAPSTLASDWRRLFDDRTEDDNQRVQREFGRLLDPVQSALRDRGFRVQDVSHKGKQAYAPHGARWLHLYVRPDRIRVDYMDAADAALFDPGYEGLLVELVLDASELAYASSIYRAVRGAVTNSQGRTWCAVKPRPIGATRIRVAIATPLEPRLNAQTNLSQVVSACALDGVERMLVAVNNPAENWPPNPALHPTAAVQA